jgi:hypothetical protein
MHGGMVRCDFGWVWYLPPDSWWFNKTADGSIDCCGKLSKPGFPSSGRAGWTFAIRRGGSCGQPSSTTNCAR